MRFILLSLILALAPFAHAQSTEAGISARLMNKPLYLRGFWSDDTLHFDSTGHLEGDSKSDSFTLSGFDLKEVQLKPDKLILEGRRIGLEFEDGQPVRVPLEARKKSHHKDVAVQIEIAAGAGGDYGPALDAIFTDDLAALVPSLPPYWKNCVSKNFHPDKIPTDSTPPGVPAKSITLPRLLHSKEPKYPTVARKLLYAGNGLYRIYAEANGTVSNISVVRPAGMGLDEAAIEAIEQYVFAPATKDGNPLTVQLNIEVNFRIF